MMKIVLTYTVFFPLCRVWTTKAILSLEVILVFTLLTYSSAVFLVNVVYCHHYLISLILANFYKLDFIFCGTEDQT